MEDAVLVNFLTGWDQAIGARAAAALAGLVVLFILARRLARRQGGWLVWILGLAAAGLLLAFAARPQAMINLIISTPYETRVRFNMGAVSVLVLLITFESIRRNRLYERYAILWVATALVIFTSALFPHSVDLFRALTGMDYATALVAMAFTFLVLVSFHFSISVSSSRSKQAKIAQRVAILEERVRQLETGKKGHDSPGAGEGTAGEGTGEG